MEKISWTDRVRNEEVLLHGLKRGQKYIYIYGKMEEGELDCSDLL